MKVATTISMVFWMKYWTFNIRWEDVFGYVSVVEDIKNEQLNVLETIFDHRVDKHIEDDTLCRPDVDSIMVERLVVRHVADNFIDDGDRCSVSQVWRRVKECKGSSSVGVNLAESSQPSPTPRRRQQSRLLELERYINKNSRILMTITPGAEKLVFPYAIRFNLTLASFLRARFQRSSNEAQMLQRPSIGVSRSLGHELVEQRGWSVDCVELLKETHARSGIFVLQAAEDAHNQMLELQSQPTLEDSQPFFGDEICEIILDAKEMIERQQVKLEKDKCMIEEQRRTSELLTSQVEEMKKMVEGKIRTQKGP
ncbi:CACTA en-spm transposon protein [Cucumis melo var. makuwa]|uniref:CACTA en-spm transposon protein n=1 Tax=Cucumis melo var. makuwa TaxID=1194695 RepID=A0A5D3E6D8_CUCMM|nr:CACTA en-spm transposon protein [Cucumis melo var. makuwa]